jgi:hypothetical protein
MTLLGQSAVAKAAARRRRDLPVEDVIDCLLTNINRRSHEAWRAWRDAGKRSQDFEEPQDVLHMLEDLKAHPARLAEKYSHKELWRAVNDIAERDTYHTGQRLNDLSQALDGARAACGRRWLHR